jgi:hypothetical protein
MPLIWGGGEAARSEVGAARGMERTHTHSEEGHRVAAGSRSRRVRKSESARMCVCVCVRVCATKWTVYASK